MGTSHLILKFSYLVQPMATCRIHEIDEKYELLIECFREAWDRDPEGLCLLHSRQVDKDKDGIFTEAVKAKLKAEDYDFRGVFFPGPFSLEKLTGQDKFTFAKPADFLLATFQGEADFSKVTFQERADFSGATFQERAYFDATFQGLTGFYETTFQGLTFFPRATFQGEAQFVRVNHQEEGGPLPPVFSGNFQYINLGQEASLVFQDCSLAEVKFEGTDLRRVEFHNVTWARRHGRNVVYNEILLHQAENRSTSESYARVEELYRQLKINYEKEGNLKSAGDFHFGEMEMHRRANKRQLWYHFYRFLSGYGERPVRALIWLLALIPSLAFLVRSLGIDKLDNLQNIIAPAGFLDTLMFIFEKATIQRPTWLKPQGFWSTLFTNLSVLLIPGQAALFILALRNRLGRRR